MPPKDRLDAIRARELLPKGVSLEETAQFYLRHHVVEGDPLTFDALVDRFIERKKKKCRANSEWPDILGDILRPFREEIGRRQVVSILEKDVTDVLERLAKEREWRATTCKQRLVVLQDLFALGVDIRAANINPAEKVKPPVERDPDGSDNDIAVVLPETVRGILAVSRDLTPAVSISFFGGLRNREVQRLDWSDIDLDRRRIEVRDGHSKTGQARWVDIADNLAAFLLPYRRASGPVVPECFESFTYAFGAVRKRAGVTKWVRGTARHCFASYYLFAGHKIDDLIRNMGHVDDVMIYTRYRELVTPEDAAEFWQIFPKEEVMMAA
jgi:integrase